MLRGPCQSFASSVRCILAVGPSTGPLLPCSVTRRLPFPPRWWQGPSSSMFRGSPRCWSHSSGILSWVGSSAALDAPSSSHFVGLWLAIWWLCPSVWGSRRDEPLLYVGRWVADPPWSRHSAVAHLTGVHTMPFALAQPIPVAPLAQSAVAASSGGELVAQALSGLANSSAAGASFDVWPLPASLLRSKLGQGPAARHLQPHFVSCWTSSAPK